MDLGSAAITRRWRLAIAVVAALSVFVALVTGSSLRPQFAAAALPEPAAWTHVIDAGPVHAGQHRPGVAAQSHSKPEHDVLTGAWPMNNKMFLSMWMPRAMPTNWPAVSPHSDWAVVPASLAPSASAPVRPDRAAYAAAPRTRDHSTLLCIVRC